MPIVFALEGRPVLSDADALSLAELLADHQDPAALTAATVIRAAVMAEDGPDERQVVFGLAEKAFVIEILGEQHLIASDGLRLLKQALTLELARAD
jgi:hypothetical protein